jgi:hypothetical protein
MQAHLNLRTYDFKKRTKKPVSPIYCLEETGFLPIINAVYYFPGNAEVKLHWLTAIHNHTGLRF